MNTLPRRSGERPLTSKPTRSDPKPHAQLTDNAPLELQEELVERATGLPGVSLAKSLVSVPGARAFVLAEDLARGGPEAFQAGREFAHIHPPHDGSLHLTLPEPIAAEAREKGWGEPHPVSGTMMVYGPRDAEELEAVWRLLAASYSFACGAFD